MSDYIHKSHNVTVLLYHLVFPAKYRQVVFDEKVDGVVISLTTPPLVQALLDSARYYQERHLWHVTLFLLMPDHLHALISFPPEKIMGKVVGNWKHFHAAKHGVIWQENYFDHRLRDVHEAEYKYQYILNNPVAKGLCKEQAQWPWKLE